VKQQAAIGLAQACWPESTPRELDMRLPFGLPTPVSTGSGSKGRITWVAPCLPLSPLGGTPLTKA